MVIDLKRVHSWTELLNFNVTTQSSKRLIGNIYHIILCFIPFLRGFIVNQGEDGPC